ncbi:MAG: hypothetical protein L6Q92_07150 [Phycisphaerae bacterium]|nr:hypothetical protein [Phycisphaerae bacterium]
MAKKLVSPILCLTIVIGFKLEPAAAQSSFVNWETPQVHPIDLTPSGNTLLVVSTADNRLLAFDVSGASPVRTGAVPVGLDPVSVRARSETEAWVVNHMSDSISIVDLPTMRVIRTIDTGDEPCDVVFAGSPQRAFASVSQLNQVRVFDPANLAAAPAIITIQGEDPRALAASPDGTRVYAAIFESGNPTTAIRQQDVSNPAGPYGGLNPPPNSGNVFNPPITPGLPPPPRVGHIVRRNAAGQWLDDNGRNWSAFVTWNLHDHDVAIIDTTTLGVTYANGMLTTVMGIGVRPNGTVSVIGTEARNQIRFEPNIRATFVRVHMGLFDPATPATTQVIDLNPHLTYATPSIPQAQRDQSIGDPRAIVWHPSNGIAYVAGMGSNSVIVTNSAGARIAQIDVAQGPTGLAMDASGGRVFVLNRFDASVSQIDTASNTETARVPFFDPTPNAIRLGRPLLYDTHQFSGLGQIACASCHIDGRTDFLAWDLGNPAGQMKAFNQDCRQPNCPDWHPMKGPMVTQSLQGIVGTEPFHWRGDRENLAAFAPAFTDLQGADAQPDPMQMQLMTDFVATIEYPPNPNRNFDGTLPPSMTLSTGIGNPNAGVNIFNTLPTVGGAPCISCHGPFPGSGTNQTIDFPGLPLAPQNLKMAQLRNMHEKTGWDRLSQQSNRGFGFNHHSEFDTLNALLNAGFAFAPGAQGQQQRRDVEALMLCFSADTHAAVGRQVTLDGTNNNAPNVVNLTNSMIALANANQVGLVVKGRQGGVQRGYRYNSTTFAPNNVFQSDLVAESITPATLRAAAQTGNELTWTVVPKGSETRIGIDRDEDGFFDREEVIGCGGDPANAAVVPIAKADVDENGVREPADVPAFVAVLLDPGSATPRRRCAADVNNDDSVNGGDITGFVACIVNGLCP